MIKRVIMVVLDSVGVGELPDAHLYGDAGSNTLANTAKAGRSETALAAVAGLRLYYRDSGSALCTAAASRLWQNGGTFTRKRYNHRTLGNDGDYYDKSFSCVPLRFSAGNYGAL